MGGDVFKKEAYMYWDIPTKKQFSTFSTADHFLGNHKSEQCFSQVKYKKEIKAIGPGRILNDVYIRVRKMMGAFYFA